MTVSRWLTEPARQRRLGLALASLVLAWIGSGTLAALALTRRWSAPCEEPTPPDLERVRLVSRDGLSIGAFLGEADAPRTAVVLVHGNGSDRSALVEAARGLRTRGHTVMPITVRAHGDSDGRRNDFGWSARLDVIAAVRFLEERLCARGESDTPVVVLGISLGAAAALFAAPELGPRVSGYVLVGPYASLDLAVSRRTERYLPPIVGELAYGALFVGGRLVLPELDRIAPAEAARTMPHDVPVLVIVGARDLRAPPSDAARITETLTDAQTVVLEDLDHEEVSAIVSSERGLEIVASFLDGLTRRAR